MRFLPFPPALLFLPLLLPLLLPHTGADDDSVVLAVMTGSGDFYCSGNDLGNFMNITPDQMAEHAAKVRDRAIGLSFL